MFLSEWCEFPSAPCLAGGGKKTRISMLLKSCTSLTCFWACFLPDQAKDLSVCNIPDEQLLDKNLHCEFARRRSSSALLSSICIYKLGKWCQLLAGSARKPWSVQPTCRVFFGLPHYIELWWVMLVPGIEVSEGCTSFVILSKTRCTEVECQFSASEHIAPCFFF